MKKAKRYHEKKNARIQDQHNDIGANAGRTGSIDQMILFAAAQNRRMQERWGAVQASKPARRLRMVIDMRKRKTVDSYFQAIQNKVGKDRSVIMLYGNRSFPPSSKDEDCVPTGSMKRHFFDEKCKRARNKQGLPVLPEERSCACDGGMEEYRRTIHRWIGAGALRGISQEKLGGVEGASRGGMQKDKLAAMNTRRGGSAEMKGKKRPYDLQNAKCSF